MTSERSQAYGRVVKALADLGPTKLHADEQQIVRDAADAMFFCEDFSADESVQRALAALYELIDNLVESERMLDETAAELVADVERCGPLTAAG